jgi:hypothetical protein
MTEISRLINGIKGINSQAAMSKADEDPPRYLFVYKSHTLLCIFLAWDLFERKIGDEIN